MAILFQDDALVADVVVFLKLESEQALSMSAVEDSRTRVIGSWSDASEWIEERENVSNSMQKIRPGC